MIRSIKEKASQSAFKAAINRRIAPYGKLERLNIDSKHKTCEATVLLEGEKDAIEVRIEGYEVRCINGTYAIRAERIEASRVWLERLLQRYVAQRSFDLPDFVGSLLIKTI